MKKQHDKADTEKRQELKKLVSGEYGIYHQRPSDISDEDVLSDNELFRPGTVDDYNVWLLDYLKQGGKITNYYDYNFDPDDLLIVNNPQKRVFLKNPRNLQFIIPKGHSFKDLHNQYDFGHATYAYGWDGEKAVASPHAWVPAYKDTIDKHILEVAHHVLGAQHY